MNRLYHLNFIMAILSTILLFNLCLAVRENSRFSGNSGAIIRREKQPREVRGFQTQMAVARGFGKRGGNIGGAGDSGENLDGVIGSERVRYQVEDPVLLNSVESFTSNKMTDSFPIDWFVEEMQNNPLLAKTVLHKFVDVNGDGLLSADELLRPSTVL